MSNSGFEGLLRAEVQAFISENIHANLPALLLKKTPFPDISMAAVARQIKGRQVAAKKFPFLLAPEILFPPGINLEQSSSSATAEYKSKLVAGDSFADLSAGFGIDAYFISKNFRDATLVEQNSQLIEIVQHNWQILGKTATFFKGSLADFLAQNRQNFDLIYVDPARRNADKRRVFLLEDLSPNLLEIQDRLFEISPQVMLKLSPLIDIHHVVSALKNLSEIHIVALKNDVKEVLVRLEREFSNAEIKIKCVNLESGEPDFSFNINEENSSRAEFSEPENYLYIPNNAVLKSGAFNLLAQRFGLKKLHPNTHLYTSKILLNNFPGRTLEIEIADPKKLKKGDRYNIISKNYPLSPEQIRRKYGISDGGTSYMVFSQSVGGKVVLKSK